MISWYTLAILSAFFLSLSRVVEKKVLFSEHALEFSTSSSLFRILLGLMLIPFIDLSVLNLKGILFIYFIALVANSAFLYRSKATKHMTISEVDPLFNLQPLFLLILSFFFLGENHNVFQVTGILILIFGTYVLEISSESKHLLDPIKKFLKSKYIHYILFTILAFSFTSMFDKIAITKITNGNPMTYLFLLYIFMVINFLALDIYRYGFKDVIYSLRMKPFSVFGATVFHFINHILYMIAVSLPGVMISLIIPIRRTSSLFSTIIGGNIFKEDKLLQKSLATIIMIAGASLIIIFS